MVILSIIPIIPNTDPVRRFAAEPVSQESISSSA